MAIFQQGQINTTALQVPGVYTQIVPPQIGVINGVPTNNLSIVGTATWGAKNAPTLIGSQQAANRAFGPLQARKYDLGTVIVSVICRLPGHGLVPDVRSRV